MTAPVFQETFAEIAFGPARHPNLLMMLQGTTGLGLVRMFILDALQ